MSCRLRTKIGSCDGKSLAMRGAARTFKRLRAVHDLLARLEIMCVPREMAVVVRSGPLIMAIV